MFLIKEQKLYVMGHKLSFKHTALHCDGRTKGGLVQEK